MGASALRLGLVGCGRIAELGYLPALARISSLELAAVADHDPARRERLAAAGKGTSSHDSLAALLESRSVDALVLATPAAAHLADARLAAEHGVVTLVEKPPAPDALSASALSELSPAPLVGFNRRFDPGVARVRAASVASPDEGVELSLELRYRRTSWRSHQAADDALLDLGPHLVDLARFLLPRSAVLAVRCRLAETSRAELRLELEHGGALLRCATDRPWRESFEARERDGRPIARHRLGGLGGLPRHVLSRLAVAARPGASRPEHPLVDSIAGQLESLAATVRGEPGPGPATAHDGAVAMAVIDAARRSVERGGRPEPPSPPPPERSPAGVEATRGGPAHTRP